MQFLFEVRSLQITLTSIQENVLQSYNIWIKDTDTPPACNIIEYQDEGGGDLRK